MRDGDYNSPSAYVSDLIRRDKHMNPLPSNEQPRGPATTQAEGSEDGRKIKRIADDLMMGKKITRADWDLPEP
jgi:hypothetical protein